MFQFSAKIFWSVLAALVVYELAQGLLLGGLFLLSEVIPWDALFGPG